MAERGEQAKKMKMCMIDQHEPMDGKEHKGWPWIVEVRTCGAWETFAECEDKETAIMLASSISGIGDDRIRISTPDHEIL